MRVDRAVGSRPCKHTNLKPCANRFISGSRGLLGAPVCGPPKEQTSQWFSSAWPPAAGMSPSIWCVICRKIHTLVFTCFSYGGKGTTLIADLLAIFVNGAVPGEMCLLKQWQAYWLLGGHLGRERVVARCTGRRLAAEVLRQGADTITRPL